jgi:hypothetical protein
MKARQPMSDRTMPAEFRELGHVKKSPHEAGFFRSD